MKKGLVVDFSFAWVRISATASVILILSGFSVPRCGATVYHSDGSVPSVQALHNAAHDGDTITLPAGTLTAGSSIVGGNFPNCLALSPDGKLMAAANWLGNDLSLFNVATDGVLTLRATLPGGTAPYCLTMVPLVGP